MIASSSFIAINLEDSGKFRPCGWPTILMSQSGDEVSQQPGQVLGSGDVGLGQPPKDQCPLGGQLALGIRLKTVRKQRAAIKVGKLHILCHLKVLKSEVQSK